MPVGRMGRVGKNVEYDRRVGKKMLNMIDFT